MGVEQTLPHIPRLRRYARLLTGNRERADDLVQDTLERACRKWSLWSPQASVGSGLRGWLLSMMHNVFVNQVRAAPNETALDELADEATHEPFAHAAERLDLQAALTHLSPGLREIILLVCVEECSYAEAAHVLGVPVGTVMSRLSRAREKLRALMNETAPLAHKGAATVPTLKLVKARPADHGR
jgi:RNA polymerase sigma-70 factor (ECF subfamily)